VAAGAAGRGAVSEQEQQACVLCCQAACSAVAPAGRRTPATTLLHRRPLAQRLAQPSGHRKALHCAVSLPVAARTEHAPPRPGPSHAGAWLVDVLPARTPPCCCAFLLAAAVLCSAARCTVLGVSLVAVAVRRVVYHHQSVVSPCVYHQGRVRCL
jgi:hypothetical protein